MSAALPAITSGLSIASSMSQTQTEAAQYESKARALERSATATRQQGREQANEIRSQRGQILGSITSSAAGSGVQVSTGSVLDSIEESAFNLEMDAQKAYQSAENQATAQEIEAQGYRAAAPSTTGVSSLLGAFGAGVTGYASGLKLAG